MTQVSEKAIGYFERAALMQPDDVKWQLMIASCYRRSGNYHKALETYKIIHRKFPENIECLKFLVKICSDMGLKEAMEYAQELKKAERARDMREQRASSSRPGSRRSSSRASANSRNGSAVCLALSIELKDSITCRILWFTTFVLTAESRRTWR